MESNDEAGIFLTLNDCSILFPRLKDLEFTLSKEERMIFLRLEKALYGNLSIREMEELLEKRTAKDRPGLCS